MVVRPAREARIFQEGHSVRLSKKRAGFSALQFGRLFSSKTSSDAPISPTYIAVKKILPAITNAFDGVDLESLHNQPTSTLSFDPFVKLERKLHAKIPRRVWALTFTLFFVVIMLYGVELFSQNHLVAGTEIAGKNLSFLTKEQANYKLRAGVESFSATLKTADQSISPTANDLGIRFDVDKTLSDAFRAQKNANVLTHLQFWKKHPQDLQVTVDTDRFVTYFEQYKQYASQPSRDALVQIKNGVVEIIPEVSAQVRGFKNPLAATLLSAKKLQPITYQQESYLETPKITKTKLESIRPQIEKSIMTPITFIQDTYVFAPSKEVVARWLVFEGEDSLNVSIDTVQVMAYLDTVAMQHLTTPKPTVSSTVSGITKELTKGSSGIDFADKTQLVASVVSALKEGTTARVDVPIESAIPSTITAGDYAKWLDVNLSTHQVTAYMFQDKVRTLPFSAGTVNAPTVRGTYAMYRKERREDRNMSGAVSNFLPNVEYISYFYKDFAFEASTWLPATVFGVSDSSHGSIDMMPQDAAWLFDWSAIGTAVVVHD